MRNFLNEVVDAVRRAGQAGLVCLGLAGGAAAFGQQTGMTGPGFGTFISAQNRWTNLFSYTNAVPLTNGQTLTVNSPPFPIARDRGFALMSLYATSNSAAGNLNFNFDFSHDSTGTNFSDTHPVTDGFALGNTKSNMGYTNNNKSVADNVRQGRLGTIVNPHTNTIWVSNCIISLDP